MTIYFFSNLVSKKNENLLTFTPCGTIFIVNKCSLFDSFCLSVKGDYMSESRLTTLNFRRNNVYFYYNSVKNCILQNLEKKYASDARPMH